MKHPVDTSQWGNFVVGELFDVQLSDGDNKPKKLPKGDIPLVSAGNTNNGIVGSFESDTIIFPAHSITVDMFGQAFYQPKEFQAVSHGRVNILVPNFENNENIGQFIVTILNAQCQKYSFTEMLTSKKIKAESIPLPLKSSTDPSNYTQQDIDWDYMETVMSRVTTRAKERLANLPQPTDKKKTPVDTSSWGEFVVGELFDCDTTKTFYPNKSELPPGNTPYITRSTYNNGISSYYDDINNEFTIEGNCLTIGAEGGIAFWQPKPFMAGVKVYTIRHPQLNELTALFIASLLNANSANYSYTNARILAKIKAESIKLPLKPSADPSNYTQEDIDWDYMESFMKTIEEKAHDRLKSLQKTIA